MKAEKRIRLHALGDFVGMSTDNTEQLYLDPADALALATELRRFVRGRQDGHYYATRIIEEGQARNEVDGKTHPRTI